LDKRYDLKETVQINWFLTPKSKTGVLFLYGTVIVVIDGLDRKA